MKIQVLFFLLFLYFSHAAGQNVDSLGIVVEKILKNFSDQDLLLQKNNLQETTDTLSINLILKEAAKYQESQPDSLLLLSRRALDLSIRTASLRNISLSLQNIGDYYIRKEDYAHATTCYLLSLRIEEKRNDRLRIADLNDDLGSVYYFLEIFDKSLKYHNDALVIYEHLHDTLNIAKVYRHLGSLHSSREYCEKRTKPEKLEDFDTAIQYFENAMKMYEYKNVAYGVADCRVNIGAVYNKMDKPEIARVYIEKALAFYRLEQNWNRVAGTLYTLGKTYFKANEFDKSIACYEESRKIAEEKGYTDGIQFLYEAMAQTYSANKDYQKAYEHYIRYMTLRDSVYNAEKSGQVLELETKYQSGLKENEILRLSILKKRKNQIIYSLAIVIGLMGASGYFVLRMHNKNKIIAGQTIEIKEKKIRELEKERQLIAAQSVLQGEEDERSRIAGDLHDGLGGLLSGVKINLSTMKENAIFTHENFSAFSHAISLLDTSISELKRIAHNLMPEILNNLGLRPALEDFCFQFHPVGKPVLHPSFFGEDLRYSKEIELTVYRIAQELVHNAMKHSEADHINLQLFSEPHRVCLQVTDDGKGFEYSPEMKNIKGNGLINIRNRVNALNGRIDFWSQPGQGTETTVEFEIS